jgi:peptide chain release factor 1
MDITPHLETLRQRFERLQDELNDPSAMGDSQRLQQLGREHSRMQPVVADYARYKRLRQESVDLEHLVTGADADMSAMAREELPPLQAEIHTLEDRLRIALLPKDPNIDRNVILEIRAGAGGDEAGLFAAELLRMYSRYAEDKKWKMEPLESSLSNSSGLKEAIFMITGEDVWSHLKFESGVHRVQRVPLTEANGRIHTSTVTVAILPEAEEIDLKIDPSDLRIDTYRASGAGGQHINKTESAIRITHVPTGFVVACQEERSQMKNRDKAMKLLRSRLLEQMQAKQAAEMAKDRKSQVGTGERSEKIRTYNFPQDRVTDHRINESFHNLPALMEGKIDDLITSLRKYEQAELLAQLIESNPAGI